MIFILAFMAAAAVLCALFEGVVPVILDKIYWMLWVRDLKRRRYGRGAQTR